MMLRIIFNLSLLMLLPYLQVQLLGQANTPTQGKEMTVSADQEKQSDLSKAQKKATRQANKEARKAIFKANWNLPYPNPYRAGIYSLAFPGAGQIYNKRYWKLPLVWGGFGALVYSVSYNKDLRDRFEMAYGRSVKNLSHEFEDFNIGTDALRRYRDRYAKNLQMTYIGFVAMYALTALDAYTDAHLKNFDISDDLAILLEPAGLPDPQGAGRSGIGLSLRLTLK